MEKLLKIHRNNDQLDFKSIWKEGLFIFDANVILDLYRLPSSAQKDLLRILKNEDFNKRIWIGFQVILEFLNNRYEAISDQKNKFNSVRKIIEDSIEQYDELIRELNLKLEKLKLKQRHSLIEPEKYINNKNTKKGIKFLNDFNSYLIRIEKKQSDVNDKDEIKDIVLEIFKDKIGTGFEKKRLQEIYKEGEKRYDADIPPGYKDIKKPGFHIYENKEYIRKYGDLVLWYEIIEKAKENKYKYIVLVTGDIKEDWWLEKRGRRLGPRLELLNEIYTKAPELETFHLYDTSSFLKYAKKELDSKIKDTSIDEAKELITFSKENRIEKEEGLVDVAKFLLTIGARFNKVKLGIGNSVKSLPLVKINQKIFYSVIMELLLNVSNHSKNGYVGVQAKISNNHIVLRFKNLLKKNPEEIQTSFFRNKGIENIKFLLGQEMMDYKYFVDEKRFISEIIIPINTVPNKKYSAFG